jgi:hypothetical protein
VSDNLKTLQSIAKSMDNPVIQWAAAEIARLREERRWVSVGERLPEDNVGVLAWGPCNGGAEMVWREHGKWHLSFVGTYIPDSTYTHWMPLPPGPEGDG